MPERWCEMAFFFFQIEILPPIFILIERLDMHPDMHTLESDWRWNPSLANEIG